METKEENISNRIEALELKILELLSRIENLEKENKSLREENASLREDNASLRRENKELKAENDELKARLKLNSTNSNKPPSSDGLTKKPAFPRGSGGKPGAQNGHKGNTLKMSDSPDEVKLCKAERCSGCGADLSSESYTVVSRRQVIDLPEPKLEITEYQLCETKCPVCNEKHLGSYPSYVKAPVQYGEKIKTMAVLLNNEYKIPFEKISRLFSDLYGCTINESTIISSNEVIWNNLEVTEEVIKERIIASPVVHFDESGIRTEGKTRWIHNSSTDKYTYLYAHLYRGKRALESKESIIKNINEWGVHDCWSCYFIYDNLKHAICGAHLLRELRFQEEIKHRKWAESFKSYLLDIYGMCFEERIRKRTEIEKTFDALCLQADNEEPPPLKTNSNRYDKEGRVKKTQGRNLFERLQKYKASVLAFAFNKEVPFTNNQAERDVRPAKIKLKVSGCFRSFRGAEHYARIQSFISTTRKHNRNVFQELCSVFKGYSFLVPICT